MTHSDHVELIEKGVEKGGTWADFGSGTGAFTLALRDIAGESVKIFSIDKDEKVLDTQKEAFEQKFPQTDITYLNQDFTKELHLPPLDGIIMANSLHFIQDKSSALQKFVGYLKKKGVMIVVEYNVDEGNHWVPYPLSFEKFKQLARNTGFEKVSRLGTISSRFLNEIYAASAHRTHG